MNPLGVNRNGILSAEDRRHGILQGPPPFIKHHVVFVGDLWVGKNINRSHTL